MKFFKNVPEYKSYIENEKLKKANNGSEDSAGVRAKSQEIIDANFLGRKLFEIGSKPTEKNPIFLGDHVGGFMHTDSGIMTVGICVKENEKIPYHAGKEIALAYAEDGEFYMADAKIIEIHDATESDIKEIDLLFKNRMQSLLSILGSAKFIIAEIAILSESKKHQRRQHLRINVRWPLYFKILNPDAEIVAAEKKWLAEKIFETSRGYFKTVTADVSAGGFKSIIKVIVPEGTELDCVIEIHGEDNMKAVGRVKGKVLGCVPSQTREGQYDMRVQFIDMADNTMATMSQHIEDKHKKNK